MTKEGRLDVGSVKFQCRERGKKSVKEREEKGTNRGNGKTRSGSRKTEDGKLSFDVELQEDSPKKDITMAEMP